MKLPFSLFILFCFFGIAGNANAQYNFNVIRTLSEMNHQVVFATYNNDGSLIVTAGSDSSLIIWNADRKIIHRTLTGLKGRPNSAVFTIDNKYVISGGRDNIATMWDLGTMPSRIVKTFEGHKGSIKSIDVSSNGKYLATGSEDKTVRIWDLQTGNLVYELKGHSKDVNSVIFTPDGKTLASGGADGVINLWNMTNGSRLVSQTGHKGYVRDLAFTNDGQLLASCGDDKIISTWQIPGLIRSGTFQGHKDRVQTVDFSPDGKNLISGGWDKLIILWDVSNQKIILQSEKQKQIVVSLDICPSQSDFISSYYGMEDLETWVITGLDEAQWKKPQTITSTGAQQKVTTETSQSEVREEKKVILPQTKSVSSGKSMIQIFTPSPVDGRIVHNKISITLVGQVTDSSGISAFMINNKPVTLSDAGVFQYTLNLRKGDNPLSLIAINKKMWMDEQNLVVVCIAEDARAETENQSDLSKAKYFALIIGINDYEDPKITDLDNPIKDAESLYNVLVTKYSFEKENMTLLKNPTLDQVYTTLEGLGKTLTINDNLLIFYAGHGYWDAKSSIGYWLPADASKSSTVKWFRNSLLRDFISSIQARHTMLIADACFSGAIFKTRGVDMANEGVTQGIEKLYQLQSRKAMTSGILEEVPDESMFLKYLVKRLDENQEKFLSSELLFSTLKMAVMNNSMNVPTFGTIQNVGDEGGDFVFIKRQ